MTYTAMNMTTKVNLIRRDQIVTLSEKPIP